MQDVVVLIPGIGGSALAKDGRAIWDFTTGAALRGVLSRGKSIDKLRMQGDDPDVDDLGDGVEATRLLPDYHVVPGLDWRIDGYGHVADQLRQRFGCVAGQNYFELPYDWRRDNRVAARALARKAHGWLRDWRARSGNDDAKLVLVGHSMGGIVARLYLELLEGWRNTRTLITLGTPYSGSLNALEFLANGFRKGWGPFSVDLSTTLRSFTSVYQLLPSYRCMGGPQHWSNLDEIDWAGTEVDGERLRAAVTLHRELRAAVDARMVGGQPGYDIRPVVGDFQRTGWSARLVCGKVEIGVMRALDEDGGDGTVPKVSAVPHELLEGYLNVSFVSQRHASLQNDGPVLDHIGGVLRAVPVSVKEIFPAPDESVSLELDDVSAEEPFVVRARAVNPAVQLTATLEGLSDGIHRQLKLAPSADGWSEGRIEGLPAQDYRVVVSGLGAHPVTDVASVIDLADLALAEVADE
jgi:pimeloyl-ACP methyl ester carboxylesterase